VKKNLPQKTTLSKAHKTNGPDPLVCLCNKISKSKIDAAMKRGCTSLQKIAAATTAGAGQCGGSCQPQIAMISDHYLNTGEALSNEQFLVARKSSRK
jgi:NAD(P)H-nitrite reductase large subunit